MVETPTMVKGTGSGLRRTRRVAFSIRMPLAAAMSKASSAKLLRP